MEGKGCRGSGVQGRGSRAQGGEALQQSSERARHLDAAQGAVERCTVQFGGMLWCPSSQPLLHRCSLSAPADVADLI